MGPPVAVGPGKKFRVSHPLSGPEMNYLQMKIFFYKIE